MIPGRERGVARRRTEEGRRTRRAVTERQNPEGEGTRDEFWLRFRGGSADDVEKLRKKIAARLSGTQRSLSFVHPSRETLLRLFSCSRNRSSGILLEFEESRCNAHEYSLSIDPTRVGERSGVSCQIFQCV